jgi:tetratricopeptide (TPR) repeat protein
MARPVNPYIAGNPVGNSPAFVGRDDVLQAVLDVLSDAQHHGVVLFGQRRIGKTSILHHLARWLPKNGGPQAIYFDLQDKAAWPVGKIMAHLAATIAEELGLPEPEPGPEPEVWFQKTWLPPALRVLPEGASLAVLFDEFDVLADTESKKAASDAFFGYLRTLLEDAAPRLRLVFVIGRNLEDLSYLAGPLFKTMPSKHVSMLPREEAEVLMRKSEPDGGLLWSGEAVKAAWALTHGHPYLLQHLCWQVWQRAHPKGEPAKGAASAADVEAAVPQTLDASRNALEWLWGGLPPAGRVVASALAKAGAGAISDEGLHRVLQESGVQVVIRDLREAPKLLQGWDLLEAVDGGHRFLVELLRRWIAQFKPLSRVQEELDKINPLAEALYQAGEGFYRAGKQDEAAAQLRQALGINPNHLKASEILAEILLARGTEGALDEAQQVLEKLGENYSAVARPRLVQVRIAQARETVDERKRLELYEQALALDEKNAVALEGVRTIWQNFGDRMRLEADLEAAAEAYREAGREDLAEEAMHSFRVTELSRLTQEVLDLEQAEQYEAAREAIHKVGETFAGLKDWTPEIERLTRAAQMLADYQRASGALLARDRETAMRLFAGIVATDPKYKDVAKLLYEAVTGVNVDGLVTVDEVLAELRQPAVGSARWVVSGAIAVGLLLLLGGGVVCYQLWWAPASADPAVSTTANAVAPPPLGSSQVAPISSAGSLTGPPSAVTVATVASGLPRSSLACVAEGGQCKNGQKCCRIGSSCIDLKCQPCRGVGATCFKDEECCVGKQCVPDYRGDGELRCQ